MEKLWDLGCPNKMPQDVNNCGMIKNGVIFSLQSEDINQKILDMFQYV